MSENEGRKESTPVETDPDEEEVAASEASAPSRETTPLERTSQRQEASGSQVRPLVLGRNNETQKNDTCRPEPSYYDYMRLPPPASETAYESHALFLLMLHDQMKETGIDFDHIDPNMYTYRPQFGNAQRLKQLAARFANSSQRKCVYQRAQSVDLNLLNYTSFQSLLTGLFEDGGVTWERVLVLFYFCTDITLRVFQEQVVHNFLDIYNWILIFLNGQFSTWIDVQGGWNIVLHHSANYISRTTALAVCCVVLAIGYWFFKR